LYKRALGKVGLWSGCQLAIQVTPYSLLLWFVSTWKKILRWTLRQNLSLNSFTHKKTILVWLVSPRSETIFFFFHEQIIFPKWTDKLGSYSSEGEISSQKNPTIMKTLTVLTPLQPVSISPTFYQKLFRQYRVRHKFCDTLEGHYPKLYEMINSSNFFPNNKFFTSLPFAMTIVKKYTYNWY